MPIQTMLCKVRAKPEDLKPAILASEKLLEEMIVAALKMLSDEWMLIMRQENTAKLTDTRSKKIPT